MKDEKFFPPFRAMKGLHWKIFTLLKDYGVPDYENITEKDAQAFVRSLTYNDLIRCRTIGTKSAHSIMEWASGGSLPPMEKVRRFYFKIFNTKITITLKTKHNYEN